MINQIDLKQSDLKQKKLILPEPKKKAATQGERLHAFLSHLVGLKGWFHLHSRHMVQILVQSNFELKYYSLDSPTNVEGKTFVLVFCNSVETIH